MVQMGVTRQRLTDFSQVYNSAQEDPETALEELTDQPVVEFLALLHGSLDVASIWLTRYSVG